MKNGQVSLVNPFCGVRLVSLNCSGVRVYACELDIFAKVITAVETEETIPAGHARLNGHSVT